MQAKTIWSFLLVLAMMEAKAQKPDDIVSYINTYKEIAMQEMQRTGVPAAIKLAQGIHETQAGTSDLVKKSNNHFGIKCKNTWTGDKVFHDDDARGECFRSYDKPEDSYRDHSDFLKNSPRYSSLFQLDPTDYKAWATGLRKAGYATNYRYSQILVKIIEDYNLEQYTLIAMGKLPATDEALASSNTSSTVIQAVSPSAGELKDMAEPRIIRVQPDYPTGEFSINNTRVVFVRAGTALLTVAEQYSISFARLLDFNDLANGDVLKDDQLVFLQRKRKTGFNEFHVVQAGETVYDICQAEGVRMENLMTNNFLSDNMQPATGEKLYLQRAATARPLLADEKKAILKETVIMPVKSADSTMHIVQTKETLYSISKKYGVSLEQLKEWNKLDSLDLKIGQQILIYRNQ
jgi:LysM repeat protein